MTRDERVKFVEDAYFRSVSEGDLDAMLACFKTGARVRIRHGDAPERQFTVDTGGGSARQFYEHLCQNFEASFTSFRHFVDVDNERSAATFVVTLKPRPQSPYAAEGTQTLHNCNFFEFEEGRICDMIIYYSNLGADASAARTPTGYPPTD